MYYNHKEGNPNISPSKRLLKSLTSTLNFYQCHAECNSTRCWREATSTHGTCPPETDANSTRHRSGTLHKGMKYVNNMGKQGNSQRPSEGFWKLSSLALVAKVWTEAGWRRGPLGLRPHWSTVQGASVISAIKVGHAKRAFVTATHQTCKWNRKRTTPGARQDLCHQPHRLVSRHESSFIIKFYASRLRHWRSLTAAPCPDPAADNGCQCSQPHTLARNSLRLITAVLRRQPVLPSTPSSTLLAGAAVGDDNDCAAR